MPRCGGGCKRRKRRIRSAHRGSARCPIPVPQDAIETIRFEAKSEDPLAVCGLTLFHREVNPLRRERLRTYRFTLPEGSAGDRNRWEVSVDLGVVARTYFLNEFDAPAWLGSTRAGLGEDFQAAQPYLYTEAAANPAATLTLRDSSNDKSYEFALEHLVPGSELAPRSGQGRVEFIEAEKVWLHAKVAGCRHTIAHASPAGLPLQRRPIPSALWASSGDQRCLV